MPGGVSTYPRVVTFSRGRVLVIIPTYNERTSLPTTVADLRRTVPEAHVLVVDDASPDGTGRWAQAAADDDEHVHVLHRAGKEGLGPAYLAGFDWGLHRRFEVLVEMDADGSHRATDLPRLLQALTGQVDLVIGSRWVPGGAVQHWPVHRRLLSAGANRYATAALGLRVRDATAGFRAYPAATLRGLDLDDVASQGYCFQIDLTRRVHRAGGRIVEVPITFVERTRGASKMNRSIIFEALWRVTAWGVRTRTAQVRSAAQALWRRN